MGTPKEVLAHLQQAFPELAYELLLKAQLLHVPPRSLDYVIEWLRTRGGMGYPQYEGYFGSSGVFRFLDGATVSRVEGAFAIFEGADPDRDVHLPQLLEMTGWVKKPAISRGFFCGTFLPAIADRLQQIRA